MTAAEAMGVCVVTIGGRRIRIPFRPRTSSWLCAALLLVVVLVSCLSGESMLDESKLTAVLKQVLLSYVAPVTDGNGDVHNRNTLISDNISSLTSPRA